MASETLPFAETLSVIASLVPQHLQKPRVGIICGSGLGGLVESLKDVVEVPYEKLPGFARSTVVGHKGCLAFGLIGEVSVVAMVGRFHAYEGHKLSSVVYPIRVMARLGIQEIIITNAAGGLNPSLAVGTIVILHDHLAIPNLTGFNALLGPLVSPSHTRFLPTSDAYSPSLRRLVFLASHHLNLPPAFLAEGTYAWVSGPTYESPAEGKFLRGAGADVVGMSTVPEVVAAREEGVKVLALSLVTNAVVIPEKYRSIKEEVQAELAGKRVEYPAAAVVCHEEVLEIGREKGEVMKSLIERVVQMIPTDV